MPTLHRLPLAAVALSAVLAQAQTMPSPAPSAAPSAATVAIVTVPKPWYAPQSLVARRMRDTIPQYAALPGLLDKMYSFAQSDGQFGGIYRWRSRAEAQAWFGPAWFERVRRERGVEGTVRLFEAPVTLDLRDGGLPDDDHARAVATLVLPAPGAGQPRDAALAVLREGLAQDRGLPGLLRRQLVVAEDGRAGELSVWADAASAQAVLGEAGRAQAARRHGAPVLVEAYDLPILTPTRLAAGRAQVRAAP